MTAAAWITIVFSAITAAIFGFTALALVVARDEVITEMERVPEFQDADIDADAAVGVLVAVMVGLVVWAVIAMVLAVLVLRRSSVSRILLVISCVRDGALLAAPHHQRRVRGAAHRLRRHDRAALHRRCRRLVQARRLLPRRPGWLPGRPVRRSVRQPVRQPVRQQPGPDASSRRPDAPQYPPAENPYGQSPSGPDPYGQQPPSADNPYGQQPPTEGGTEYPPRDYPNR